MTKTRRNIRSRSPSSMSTTRVRLLAAAAVVGIMAIKAQAFTNPSIILHSTNYQQSQSNILSNNKRRSPASNHAAWLPWRRKKRRMNQAPDAEGNSFDGDSMVSEMENTSGINNYSYYNSAEDEEEIPQMGANGIYTIRSEKQYNNFLESNPNKLIVIKFFATYCRACAALAPKFLQVKNDDQLKGLPIVWAEFPSKRSNKDLFRKLGVLTLPTVHFYEGNRGLVENFPCGPAKIPVFKQKLARFINSRVDPNTLQLKAPVIDSQQPEPRVERQVLSEDAEDMVTQEHIDFLRNGMPFFKDLSEPEFQQLLDKTKLLTFDPDDLIIRQGMAPTTFYVIKSGIAEMNIRSKFDDPMTCPPNYLGVAVSQLKQFDYFGERALTTGEPYAASVRVLEKVRCFAFDVNDIPENSILSKKRRATEDMVQMLNTRYTLPDDYTNPYPSSAGDERVLDLLVRFKQIRQAAQCFEYIVQSAPTWGNTGEIARRTALVSKLSRSQREEFQEVFNLVDSTHRGKISLLEMQKFMQSARSEKSTEELLRMMAIANPSMLNNPDHGITRDEFMGVMAEAEFFNLFKETFQELDKDNTGYVRAGDLDEVLGGVRDLLAEDTSNSPFIDVEDKDILVDYEQFSKMLLGAAL